MLDAVQVTEVVTDCSKCAHVIEIGGPHVWYHQICGVSPLWKEVDPKDGKMRHVNFHEGGRKYFTDHAHQFCKNVNFGHCKKFDSKPGVLA